MSPRNIADFLQKTFGPKGPQHQPGGRSAQAQPQTQQQPPVDPLAPLPEPPSTAPSPGPAVNATAQPTGPGTDNQKLLQQTMANLQYGPETIYGSAAGMRHYGFGFGLKGGGFSR